MDLLNICLTFTYVPYNANCTTLNFNRRTMPLWLCYIDDTFTAEHKDVIDDFHEHLNKQNADIKVSKEIAKNGKIPFLDCLVTRNNNRQQTTIYRKPTYTDRLLNQSLYNPTSHKATTIRTLTRRAQLVCDSPNSLQDKTDYLNNVFSKNNYNMDFVRWNTHSNTDSCTRTNVNSQHWHVVDKSSFQCIECFHNNYLPNFNFCAI